MDKRPPAITANQLTKRFGNFTAVNQVGFTVKTGEIFGFLGPNGSGKTTTIRMTLGLLKPSSGSVEVLGIRVDGNAARMRPRIGYMSQRFSLYNDLTVMQNLHFYGAAYGLRNTLLEERIEEALVMAGLEGRGKNKTRDLSGGWRQRLALSAAILHRPEILFLDEPTSGVDPISRRAFWDLLYHLVSTPVMNADKKHTVTVFVTTHYMDEAEHCHRLAFIQHGNIIAQGSPAQIKSEVMRGQVLEIAPSNAVQAVKVLRDARESGKLPVDEIELYGSLVHVVAPEIKSHEKTIRESLKNAGIDPGQLSIIDPSLEDVFIACMKN
ncbi:MAG: ABC transporter ATP-binding protein [Anaerolineales bacterium]|nr:ABC transporter ATP-binding protein [Anaerolineales bacterium]